MFRFPVFWCCLCAVLAYAPLSVAEEQKFNPAIIYLSASDRDGTFVDSGRMGLAKAENDFHAHITEYRATTADEIPALIKRAADAGANPVIALGYQNVVPVLNLAERYPRTRFTVIDGLVPPLYPNVQSILFKDHEGAFLVGMIAGKTSRSGHVGFIGGMDVPLIRNFAKGYIQGVRYANPKAVIDSVMIGDTADAWSNPTRAHELALAQFANGVEVVFAPAGGSSVGVLRAANDAGKLAIGVDSNQNGLYPGRVLTSMVKRVDLVIYDALKSARNGEWSPGIKYLGIKEGALDYAVDQYNQGLISEKLIDQVANAKERIINGIIIVDTYQAK
ncbi:MAG: BMP family protein [Rickettsiales bacterium]